MQMTDAAAPHRETIIRWEDPEVLASASRQMSGLEFLEAVCAGRLPPPPVARLVGFTIDEVAEGRTVMSMLPSEAQYNPIGSVHGGIIATLLDSVMGCAVHSTLPVGRGYTTLEIKVNYLRAVTQGSGRVRAEGRIIHAGRQSAMAEGRLVDATGRVHAHATTTCLIFDRRPERA
jgi:uncharacterized protein (TIGR00369 family)